MNSDMQLATDMDLIMGGASGAATPSKVFLKIY